MFSKRNQELIRQWYMFYNQQSTITKQLASQLKKNCKGGCSNDYSSMQSIEVSNKEGFIFNDAERRGNLSLKEINPNSLFHTGRIRQLCNGSLHNSFG